jgi:hypothetical protein
MSLSMAGVFARSRTGGRVEFVELGDWCDRSADLVN